MTSGGFTAVPEALTRASAAAQDAAAGAHGVDGRGALEGAAGAMPGSQTQKSASIAADALGWMLVGWVEQASGYATDLAGSATSYRQDDQQIAAAMNGAAPPAPGFPTLDGPTGPR